MKNEEQAPQSETPDAAPRPTLPDAIEQAVAAWESAAVESLGPHLTSTHAANVFHALRVNLRATLAAALASQ